MRRSCLLSVVSTFIFALVMPALSSAEQNQPGQENPCTADMKKLCGGVKPGEGRLMECLKEHKAELSPACTEIMAEQKDKIKTTLKKCEPDIQKFCSDVKPGGGRIITCLKNHQAELSQECRDTLTSKKGT